VHFRGCVDSAPHLGSQIACLTNFDEIWHCHAPGSSAAGWPLKFLAFENPKWRTAAILKIENSDILATVWAYLVKFGNMLHFGLPDSTNE